MPSRAGPEALGLPEDKFSAEAALVGRDFGLGEPAAVRTARRRDPMFGCGTILLDTEAERVLASRLLPGLIEDYEAGRPVVFCDLRFDRLGVAHTAGQTWYLPWEQVRRVTDDGPGRAVEIRPIRESGREHKRIDLNDCPNAVLAHHLIEHAGVPVRHGSRFWRPDPPASAPQDVVQPSD